MSKFAGLALAVDKPSRLELRRPDDNSLLMDKDGNVAYIDLLSTDSTKAKAFEKQVFARRQRAGTKNPSADEIEATVVERDAELTAGWYLVGLNGEHIDVPCNKQNAMELYREPATAWIRDLVRDYMNERGNFIEK